MDKFDVNCCKLLVFGGVVFGVVILLIFVFVIFFILCLCILIFNNFYIGELIKVEFFDGRGYIQEELVKFNYFFCDYCVNKIKFIDSGLFDQLYCL